MRILLRPGPLRERARFLSRFLFLVALLVGLTFTNVFESQVYSGYVRLNAAMAAWVIDLFGSAVQVLGVVIQGDGAALQIGRGCTAVEPTAFVVAALLAAPLSPRRKAFVCLRGMAILGVANIFRIVSLFEINARAPAAFDVVHRELWPILMLAIAGVVVFVSMEHRSRVGGPTAVVEESGTASI